MVEGLVLAAGSVVNEAEYRLGLATGALPARETAYELLAQVEKLKNELHTLAHMVDRDDKVALSGGHKLLSDDTRNLVEAILG